MSKDLDSSTSFVFEIIHPGTVVAVEQTPNGAVNWIASDNKFGSMMLFNFAANFNL